MKMKMAKERASKFIRLENTDGGGVGISDDVVAVIAGYAATEVEGVASMAGGITGSLLSRAGMKMLSKGVRIFVDDQEPGVRIDLAIIVRYGHAIPEVCSAVQDKVKSSVETMTGLNVLDVNIRIAGVVTPKAEDRTE